MGLLPSMFVAHLAFKPSPGHTCFRTAAQSLLRQGMIREVVVMKEYAVQNRDANMYETNETLTRHGTVKRGTTFI